MTPSRILIAGIGNIFLGDDAFGVEVARRMAAQLPDEEKVKLADFVIDNCESLAKTREQVEKIWNDLKAKVAK